MDRTVYLAQYVEWEMFQAKVVEKIITHFMFSKTFFRKSCHLWDNMLKSCTAGQATHDIMTRAHCMLDT
jgi:hypothetical protein